MIASLAIRHAPRPRAQGNNCHFVFNRIIS